MEPIARVNKEAEQVAIKAEEHLQGVDPSPFSAAAFSILKGKVGQYVNDLISESIKISKLDQSDSVSTKHVELASKYLTLQGNNRIYRLLGTFGGVLLGASISNFLTMLTTEQYSKFGISGSLLLLLVGTCLTTFNYLKD
jgi:hypothetical protein